MGSLVDNDDDVLRDFDAVEGDGTALPDVEFEDVAGFLGSLAPLFGRTGLVHREAPEAVPALGTRVELPIAGAPLLRPWRFGFADAFVDDQALGISAAELGVVLEEAGEPGLGAGVEEEVLGIDEESVDAVGGVDEVFETRRPVCLGGQGPVGGMIGTEGLGLLGDHE